MTDRYAVIGNPISQTKSPLIHAAFARQCGQDMSYAAISAPIGGFSQAVADFCREGGKGLNVTIPFKVDAVMIADHLTERAQLAQAVNTLKFDESGVLGDNTDGIGLVHDIQVRLGISLRHKRILLIGAGGVARGVLLPLLEEGPARLLVVNRTPDKAEALIARFADRGHLAAGGFADIADQQFDVLINATSASFGGECLPLPADCFAPDSLAYDMAYGRGNTPFMTQALASGAGFVTDGLGMLVAQAAESFFLWRGVRPDVLPVIEMLIAAQRR